jgi:hypothetical protein
MKTIKSLFFGMICMLFAQAGVYAQNAWFNEIHYDNAGTDVDEFIEVILENPGNYNLADFSVILYNGNDGGAYDTTTLNNYAVGATVGNFKIYWLNFTSSGLSIQNGPSDGMALVYQGTVITGQFLSYEGTLTASNGPASGLVSVDIGVAESNATPSGYSLQLSGNGTVYAAFAWQPESTSTPGALNTGQNLSNEANPEPTNYPTNFTATPHAFTINLSWNDATGTQLPAKYLVLASEQDNIVAPVDGVTQPDDADLSDGTAALNIAYDLQSCQFGNLPSNKQYFFKIFPYTNAGTSINYKTDGTPPSTSATTPNAVIINYENFNDTTMGAWIQKSVTGDQMWVVDTIHGIGGTPCVKASGYSGGVSNSNEDWLISPAMDFDHYSSEALTFQTARSYSGPDLQVLVSSDYDGAGDPNSFTWTPLTATFSAGSWTWTHSGIIDVSGFNGTAVHVAFKYVSDTASATWEVDEILTSGVVALGVPQVSGNKDFTISPNPSHGVFRLVFNDPSQKEVQIISLVGKELFRITTTLPFLEINIPELSAGIYFVKVSQQGSSAEMTKKIIIQ